MRMFSNPLLRDELSSKFSDGGKLEEGEVELYTVLVCDCIAQKAVTEAAVRSAWRTRRLITFEEQVQMLAEDRKCSVELPSHCYVSMLFTRPLAFHTNVCLVARLLSFSPDDCVGFSLTSSPHIHSASQCCQLSTVCCMFVCACSTLSSNTVIKIKWKLATTIAFNRLFAHLLHLARDHRVLSFSSCCAAEFSSQLCL